MAANSKVWLRMLMPSPLLLLRILPEGVSLSKVIGQCGRDGCQFQGLTQDADALATLATEDLTWRGILEQSYRPVWTWWLPIPRSDSGCWCPHHSCYGGSSRSAAPSLKPQMGSSSMDSTCWAWEISTRTIRTPAFWGYLPPPPHDYPYYWVILDPKSKEDKVKVINLKDLAKFQICEFWHKLYMRHTFWSSLIRCANMKWIRWVLLKIQSGHDSVHRGTYGQGETSIPPFQLRWSGGYDEIHFIILLNLQYKLHQIQSLNTVLDIVKPLI